MKISTEYIKKQISVWHTSTELREKVTDYYSDDDDEDELAELAENFKLKKGATSTQIYDKMYDLLRDGKQWSRESKEKDTGNLEEPEEAIIDFFGEIDVEKIKDIYKSGLGSKIICRTFTPKNDQLGDNFRLEVYSDPEDKEIICHNLIVD